MTAFGCGAFQEVLELGPEPTELASPVPRRRGSEGTDAEGRPRQGTGRRQPPSAAGCGTGPWPFAWPPGRLAQRSSLTVVARVTGFVPRCCGRVLLLTIRYVLSVTFVAVTVDKLGSQNTRLRERESDGITCRRKAEFKEAPSFKNEAWFYRVVKLRGSHRNCPGTLAPHRCSPPRSAAPALFRSLNLH